MPTAGGLDFSKDEIFTESFWPVDLTAYIFQKESSTTGPVVAGVLYTAVWAVGMWHFRSFFGL